MERYLDETEVPMLNRGPAQIVQYAGEVDREALARAFDRLCTLHPVLRGHIRADDRGYLLSASADRLPEFTVCDGDETVLHSMVQRTWDRTVSLAELMLIQGDSTGFVVLRVDHAVADNAATEVMFGDLWHLYTEIAEGREPAVVPGVLPSSPARLFEERTGVTPPPHIFAPRDQPAIQMARQLTVDETTALVTVARSRRTSIHALIAGAILTAVRNHAPGSEAAPMACMSVVNLRGRVSPPVKIATETTNLLGLHRAEVTVPPAGDPVGVGREVKTQIDSATAGIARGELFQADPTLPVDTSLPQHLAKALITNAGAFQRYERPAGLSLPRRLMIFSDTTVAYPWHALYTYEGKLNLVARYPSTFFRAAQMEEIVDEIMAGLRETGAGD